MNKIEAREVDAPRGAGPRQIVISEVVSFVGHLNARRASYRMLDHERSAAAISLPSTTNSGMKFQMGRSYVAELRGRINFNDNRERRRGSL
jgi:hypothetical protein